MAVGIKIFFCMAQNDTPMTNGRMSADSTKYIVNIEGKEIEFSLTYNNNNTKTYYQCGSFIENDTLFFDREYTFYHCDTCIKNKITISNYYFLTPRTSPEHSKEVGILFTEWTRNKEIYKETLNYLYSVDSTVKLTQQNLGDIPRVWYPLMKHKGQFYLSIDYTGATEFTDSTLAVGDMELYVLPLRNVRKLSTGKYYYEYAISNNEWFSVVLQRSSKNKDFWIMTTKSLSDKNYINYEAVTPKECIGNFDLINCNNIVPLGFCDGYEEVSPEDY